MKKIIQITSGRGPAECNFVVTNVFKRFQKYCEDNQIKIDVIERELDKDFNQLASIILELESNDLNFLMSLEKELSSIATSFAPGIS